MKAKFYLLLFLAVAITSCKKESISSTARLTISNFKTKKPEMDYISIVAQFAALPKIPGSGIHIHVYIPADSTEIWIGYVDKI